MEDPAAAPASPFPEKTEFDRLSEEGDDCLIHGNYSGALESYLGALKINPSDAKVNNNVGHVYVAMSRSDLAIKHFQVAVESEPELLECHHNLIKSLMTVGRVQDCLDAVRTGLSIHRNDMFLMIQLGNMWRLQGKEEEALSHFHMLLEKYETYILRKRQEKADEDAFEADEDAPVARVESSPIEYTEEEKRYLAMIYHKTGVVHAASKRLTQAVEAFMKAYDLHPTSCEVLRDLGKIHFQLRQFQESDSYYKKLLFIDPANAEAHTGLGLLMLEEAKLKTEYAFKSFQKALDSNPLDLAQAHFNMASALHKNSMIDEAIAHYEEALKVDPNYVPALNNLGLILETQGHIERACENYQKAVQINPNDERSLFNYANTLYRLERLDEALACYEKVLRINRENAIAWNYQGLVYTDLRQYDRAIGCFQNAIRLRPDLIMVHDNVRRVLQLQQGDYYCVIS